MWRSLESLLSQIALPGEWQSLLRDHFEPFKTAFLQPTSHIATSIGCPRQPGYFHPVVPEASGVYSAPCPLFPAECQVPLTQADLVLWQLNHSALGRALCKTFALDPKPVALTPHNTRQIGSRSVDSIPVILTIQTEPRDLLSVTAQLAATLRQKFVLLIPTNDLLTAPCQAILQNCGAIAIPLDSAVTLTPQATLQLARPVAELFAPLATPSKIETQKLSTLNPQLSTSAQFRSSLSSLRSPRFSLRKGLRAWDLVFDGQPAPLNHRRGILFVAWLLYNPPENPIHALDLTAKIPELYRQQLGLPMLVDQTTGKAAPLQSGARIQERSLALDDAQAMRVLYKKQKELEDILESVDECEPVKAEALRELEAIYNFQRQHGRRTKDSAHRAVDAVRKAISRFHQELLTALDTNGNPHPVLRPFAHHLEKHLLIPSARYCGPTGKRARGPLAGCFTYEPPPGIKWLD